MSTSIRSRAIPSRARVVVIGGGVAGLAVALELSAADLEVILLERAHQIGGKLHDNLVRDRPIPNGPTVFTMRWVFDELLRRHETTLEDHLSLGVSTQVARHVWRRSEQLDLYADLETSAEAVGRFAGVREAQGYRRFSKTAQRLFETLEHPFMRAGITSPPAMAADALQTGFASCGGAALSRSLASSLRRYFRDPRLIQLFGRYATYTGSSPFQAPALLMLIAHVERMGVWFVEGGLPALARALATIATKAGVSIRCGTEVRKIVVSQSRAAGVELSDGEFIPATAVVHAGDVDALRAGLLGPDVASCVGEESGQRSMSALTWTLHARPDFPLRHHTVFFSDDYRAEFRAIFGSGTLPADPTIYVCAPHRADDQPENGPDSEEPLFLLVNAPGLADSRPLTAEEIEECRTRSFGILNSYGMNLNPHAPGIATGPTEFAARFPGTGGSLYGRANHGWTSAFRRPRARTKLAGLYLAGGSVHPGPGVPMAALSGRLASACLLADLASTSMSRQVVTHGGISTRSTPSPATG